MKRIGRILILVSASMLYFSCSPKPGNESPFKIKTLRTYASPGSMATSSSSVAVTLNLEGAATVAKYSVDGTDPSTGTDFSGGTVININVPVSGETTLRLYTSNGKITVTNEYYYKNGTVTQETDFNQIRMYQITVEAFRDEIPGGYGVGYGPSSHNGDIQGITSALDYIKSLNLNAIWLTPVFNSESVSIKLRASGYFCDDYFNVDPNFGTNEDLRKMINEAHKRGIYVFLDGVFGHHGSSEIEGVEDGGSQSDGYKTNFPASLDFFKNVAAYWIDNYEIDGWRLDQAYQLYQGGHNYWKEIREVVEARCAARKAAGCQWGTLGYMVGEVWDGASYISTTGYGNSSVKGLESCFDFPTRYNLVQVLACQEDYTASNGKNQPASILNSALSALDASPYPSFAKPNLMLTNHDLVRLGDLIQRAELGDKSSPAYWKRHKAAISFLAAYTGPITLYYGDEIGDEVSGYIKNQDRGYYDDHVSRSNGQISGFDPDQTNLKNYVSGLMQLKKDHPALWNGDRTNLISGKYLFADLKTDTSSGEKIVYIMNSSVNDQVASFSTAGSSLVKLAVVSGDSTETVSPSSGNYSITVPALSGVFYKVQ